MDQEENIGGFGGFGGLIGRRGRFQPQFLSGARRRELEHVRREFPFFPTNDCVEENYEIV